MTEADLGKRLRQQVKAKAWPVLKQAGFDDFGPLVAWRHSDQQTDCVQFQTLPPQFGHARHVGIDRIATAATFQLVVGTYYVGVHTLPWFGDLPLRPAPARGASTKGVCHREISLARSYHVPETGGTIFYVDPSGSNLEMALEDAVNALVQRGLPWLKETRDMDTYLSMTHPRSHPAERIKLSEVLAEESLQDHIALDRPPGGPERLALLCSMGRWDEALAAQRRLADPEALAQEFEGRIRNVAPNSRQARFFPKPDEGAIKQMVRDFRRSLKKKTPIEEDRLRQLEEAYERLL